MRLFVFFIMGVIFVLCLNMLCEHEPDERKETEIPATTYLWPEVFTNPDFVYEGPDAKPRAIADGLSGWGNCLAGAKLPKTFGQGMVKIGNVLGVTSTLENLHKLEDEFLKQGGE